MNTSNPKANQVATSLVYGLTITHYFVVQVTKAIGASNFEEASRILHEEFLFELNPIKLCLFARQ